MTEEEAREAILAQVQEFKPNEEELAQLVADLQAAVAEEPQADRIQLARAIIGAMVMGTRG